MSEETLLAKLSRAGNNLARITLGELVAPNVSPKLKNFEWNWASLITDDSSLAGLHKYLKEYKRISVVKQCINMVGFWSTQKGATTQIETVDPDDEAEKYIHVKRAVDAINRRVNLDRSLWIAQVKRSIYGQGAFEIVRDNDNDIARLLPLKSDQLTPHVDEDWNLVAWNYNGEADKYKADEVLCFLHNELEADWVGISDIEPVYDLIQTKRNLEYDIQAVSKRMWAPMAFVKVDTSGAGTPVEEDALIEKVKKELMPGRSYIHNQTISAEKVDLQPDLQSLINAKEKIDEEIIGNWNIPKALLAREKTVTRATLEVALKALYEGPIEGIQQDLKRKIEKYWYDPIVDDLGYAKKIRIKHIWNPISWYDFILTADPIAKLYESKIIDHREARNMLRMDTLHFGQNVQQSEKSGYRQKALEDFGNGDIEHVQTTGKIKRIERKV